MQGPSVALPGAALQPGPVRGRARGLFPGDGAFAVLAEEFVEGLAEQGLDGPILHDAERAQLAVDGLGKVAGDGDAVAGAVPGALGAGGGVGIGARERAGWTERMGYAHSVVDYLFRWLGSKFPGTGAVDPPTAVADGETCGVCGTPVTWGPGSPCPDCGDIGL